VVVRMLVTSLLSALASATPPRLLVYVPTHLSDDHAACLTCWPAMLAHAPLLRTADVLVYAGGPAAAVPAARLSWESIVKALPNRNATIFFSTFNPGYQSGAKYAMHVALRSGWFGGYDWVVRMNPDVMVLNETELARPVSSAQYAGVFANCAHSHSCREPGCVRGIIQTDIFAVRPTAFDHGAFACWNTSSTRIKASRQHGGPLCDGRAEDQAKAAFRPIVMRGADYWLNPGKPSYKCRIDSHGLRHVNMRRPGDEQLCDARCSAWSAPSFRASDSSRPRRRRPLADSGSLARALDVTDSAAHVSAHQTNLSTDRHTARAPGCRRVEVVAEEASSRLALVPPAPLGRVAVVVAFCTANVSWLADAVQQLRDQGASSVEVSVYSKCGRTLDAAAAACCNVTLHTLPNVGRCDHTYAHYIAESYDKLPDSVA